MSRFYFESDGDRPRRETPSGVRFEATTTRFSSLPETATVHGCMVVPETVYEAVMQADFMEEPKLSVEETEEATLAMQQMLEEILTPDELVVVEAIVFGGHTLEEAGMLLARSQGRSKSYVKGMAHKVRERAYEKIRERMSADGNLE